MDNAPLSSKVSLPPRLCNVGKVDNPEIILPVTPMEIGDESLVNPLILPQEYLPTGDVVKPIVFNPLVDVSDFMVHVIIPDIMLGAVPV